MNVLRVIVIGMLLLLTTVVEAKDTKLRISDHGLLGAMHRMGCGTSWLSVVMRNNSIAEVDLTSMRKGRPLTMPKGCESGLPSLEDRLITQRVFSHRHEAKHVELIKIENKSLTKQNGLLLASINLANKRIVELEEGAKRLREELSIPIPPTFAIKAMYCGLGLAFGLIGWLLWRFVWLPRVGTIVYKNQQVFYAGTRKNFKLKAIEYTCPDHPDQSIDRKHLSRHLQRAHVRERLDVQVIHIKNGVTSVGK